MVMEYKEKQRKVNALFVAGEEKKERKERRKEKLVLLLFQNFNVSER